MTKTETILCPTDFSDNASHAFDFAQLLAEKCDATVELLHVYHIPLHLADVLAPTSLEEMDPGLRESLEHDLRKFAGRHARKDVPVTFKLRVGNPSHEIIEEAERIDAHMIVMGILGLTGLQRVLVGSVAEQVVRLATHPVLTVRYRKNHPHLSIEHASTTS